MSKFNYVTPACCDRPNVGVMDHEKRSPDDWYNPIKIINRICLSCKTHWYGPLDSVKQYTGKEWDLMVGVI